MKAVGNIARTPGAKTVLLPHQSFTAAGETYLYASETGGLFRVDDGVRDALSNLSSIEEGKVPAVILSELRRAGLLGATGDGGPAGRTAHPPLRLRTLVLMLTYSCNLACRYCYEDREDGCAPRDDGPGGGGPSA
ncbi:MAG TPA: hypothetical protein VN450_02165, partial [Candidatus Methylomirabilis sp.]|nr:hypothetical protein [Candidatus Methylomirabilis sp.]